MVTCMGKGALVAVGVGGRVGCALTGCRVAVVVGFAGFGVTGNAVGTGPGGLMMFFMYKLYFSMRQAMADFTVGICKPKTISKINPANTVKIIFMRFDMLASLS